MTTHYTIQLGDEVIKFEGPDDLSDRQIERLADSTLRHAKPGQSFPHSKYVGVGEPDAATSPDSSSAVGAFIRNLPRDAYFNWGDEVASAANAVIPGLASLDNAAGVSGGQQTSMYSPNAKGFWDAFHKNMGDFRQQQAADVEHHPTASALGDVTGVVGTLPLASERTLALLPRGLKVASEAHPFLTALGLGGAGGAVSGAGAGEGNRAQSAAAGGLTGAALAFGLTGAIQFAPKVAQYAKMLFKNGATENAIGQLKKALMRDGFDVTTPQGSAALQQELARYGTKPVSLADVGSNTRARAGVGLRSPSAAQQQSIDIVGSRQAGQGQRLAGDIRANVAPRTDVHALEEDLVAQRAAEAEPLREKALFEQAPDPAEAITNTASSPQNAGVKRTLAREVVPTAENPVVAGGKQSRIVDDPQLQGLARLPLAQRALTAALDQAEAERGLLASTGQSIEHLPDLSRGSQLDMRTFDYLKRFLDDEVTRLYKRGDTSTFSAAQASQVKALRDAIRERLKTINPDYADYLGAYKGSSEMIDSLEQGRSFDNLDPEQIAKEQAKRSTAGQELYRVGAARNLLEKVRDTKDGATAAKRILNSPESRAQLEATGVTPSNMARLNTAVEQERALSLLPEELKGSQTDARRLANQDVEGISLPFSGGFSAGGGYGWLGLKALGQAVLNRGLPARNAVINEVLLPRMLEQNPEGIKNIIAELEQHGQKEAAAKLRRLLKARQSSLNSAVIIGGMTALPNVGDQ